jgi:hypothetical protein
MATSNDLAAYKRMLASKIESLQFIGTNLARTKRISIEVTLDCGSRLYIEQNIIPFNLEMELRILVGDSIDYYQRQLSNLESTYYEQI